MRKYFVGIAILVSCACLLAFGLHGFLEWLRDIGFSIAALYFVGGSVYLTIRFARGDKIRGPQLGLFPKSWQRWILDEPVPKLDPRRRPR